MLLLYCIQSFLQKIYQTGQEGHQADQRRSGKEKNHELIKHPHRTEFLMILFSLYLFSVGSNLFQFADEDVHLQGLDEAFQTAHSIYQKLTVLP